MTTDPSECRKRRVVRKIQSMFHVHAQLCHYASKLQVRVEGATVLLDGEVPSPELRAALVPAVRAAGVLSRVLVQVRVSSAAADLRGLPS